MEYYLNEDAKFVIEEARRFAEEKLEPFAEEYDRKNEVNHSALKELGELGYMGMLLPEEYGGSGMGSAAYVGSIMEFSKADAGTAVALSVQNSLVCEAVYKFGTEEQKKNYLPKLASGEMIGCFSLSEPNAGSDPGSLRTNAILSEGKWLVNGTKNFTTNGGIADLIILFARTDPEAGNKGVTAFLVESLNPGFKVGKHEDKMGIRSSSTTEMVFENCYLEENALLGELNHGLKVALTTLDGGRLGIAAQAIGIAEGAFNEALKYVNERVQFGKPLAKLQTIQFKLAEMATEIELAKTMLYNICRMKDDKMDYSKESAMIKLYASEMAHRVCHQALQMHGGYGFIKDYKVERLYRDQRITEIYEGTSEIQKLVISRSILKEYSKK